ncbi:hypothetical protein D8770_26825 [Methylobacterium sp. DB1607]|nr:hypothetical protein [Methylobacterium sp. DB1607]
MAYEGDVTYAIRVGTAFENLHGFLPRHMLVEKPIPDGDVDSLIAWCGERGIALTQIEKANSLGFNFPDENAEMEFRLRWE